MYDHTLPHGKIIFPLLLTSFSTEEVLKRHIKDCFKISDKKKIIMLKKGENVKFRNYERKIKSTIIIHANFESILVLENNGKKIQKILMRTNIKSIFFAVVTIN